MRQRLEDRDRPVTETYVLADDYDALAARLAEAEHTIRILDNALDDLGYKPDSYMKATIADYRATVSASVHVSFMELVDLGKRAEEEALSITKIEMVPLGAKGTSDADRAEVVREERCYPDCCDNCICDRYPDTPRDDDEDSAEPVESNTPKGG